MGMLRESKNFFSLPNGVNDFKNFQNHQGVFLLSNCFSSSDEEKELLPINLISTSSYFLFWDRTSVEKKTR
jgi:hypothetical protein